MSKIVLSLETLEKLKRFASTEETRYYLNGLYFHYRADRKDFVIMATNGHYAVVFKSARPWDGEAFESFILPSSDILGSKSFVDSEYSEHEDEYGYSYFEKNNPLVHVAIDTETKRIAFLNADIKPIGAIPADQILSEGLSKKFTPIDGTYPEYERTFPKPEDLTGCETVAFNVKYLADIVGISSTDHASFFINKDNNAPSIAFIQEPDNDEYVFLLMPVVLARGKSTDKYPEWIVRKEKM
jgi:DNA polymerase III sliding clamp (beta) subunit (PCNA family)